MLIKLVSCIVHLYTFYIMHVYFFFVSTKFVVVVVTLVALLPPKPDCNWSVFVIVPSSAVTGHLYSRRDLFYGLATAK